MDKKEEEISARVLIQDFQKGVSFLNAKKIWIGLFFILGCVLGLIYSFIKKPSYRSELTFVLQDEKGGVNGALSIASQFGFDLGGNSNGAFTSDNLLELLKSRNMVQKTLLLPDNRKGNNKTLAQDYFDINKKRYSEDYHSNLFPLNLNQENLSLKQDSLLREFHKDIVKKYLYVDKLDKKLSIILVKFDFENEIFARNFVENLVSTVSAFYIQTKTKKEKQNVTILQNQVDSVRRELNKALYGVAGTIDLNPNSNSVFQRLRVPSQKQQIDVQANTAILTELVKNLELSRISLRKETPLIQIIDRPILPLEEDKPGKIKFSLIGGLSLALIYIIYIISIHYYRKIMNP